jgi:hypothetical protein
VHRKSIAYPCRVGGVCGCKLRWINSGGFEVALDAFPLSTALIVPGLVDRESGLERQAFKEVVLLERQRLRPIHHELRKRLPTFPWQRSARISRSALTQCPPFVGQLAIEAAPDIGSALGNQECALRLEFFCREFNDIRKNVVKRVGCMDRASCFEEALNTRQLLLELDCLVASDRG